MAAPREKPRLKTFHATVTVTRTEEWCVEAETPAQAEALLVAGEGQRCQMGDCLQIEVETIAGRD